MAAASIPDDHTALAPSDRASADALRAAIHTGLPHAQSNFWHAHPVWSLNANPIIGYSKLKSCMRLLV